MPKKEFRHRKENKKTELWLWRSEFPPSGGGRGEWQGSPGRGTMLL